MSSVPLFVRGLLLFAGLVLVGCSEREDSEREDAVQPAPLVSAVERPVITRKDDLPRHSYRIEIPAVALYEEANRETLMALAEQIRSDVEQDLASFDIEDASTLQDFYADLGSVALMQGRWQDYLDYVDQRRELETKPANKLTMSLEGVAIARAQLAQAEDVGAYAAEYLGKRLAELPYEVVQDNLKRAKGRTEILSRALVLGSIESGVQPVLDNTGGEMSYDIASRLVGTTFALDYYIPAAAGFNKVYSAVIDANHVEKVDIWEARKVVLDAGVEASPAIIAVWDSGVDVALFEEPSQLWINEAEVPDNGIDDDNNGFVDDVHGIAFTLHADKSDSLLFPIGEFPRDEQVLQRQIKGLGDLNSAVDSEEASALRADLAALQQAEVKDFIESINLYGGYAHGTHVAGITLEGNPYARLLTARLTFSHEMIPEEPTREQTIKDTAVLVEIIDYFKAAGVRAVNMSWGGSLRSIESALEAHNVGATPEERKALARELYNIGDSAFRQAVQDAPDILFITSAGNSDNDVTFDEFYPSSYDYPNILSVGAVDEEGNETSFTSLGKVDVYANGFEVESYVPGGNRIKFNGTSMASPQVLNLAAKLLALNPELTTVELRQLIVDGADARQIDSREIRLMNPQHSVELLTEGSGAE
jgi:subtilisin family serine protease